MKKLILSVVIVFMLLIVGCDSSYRQPYYPSEGTRTNTHNTYNTYKTYETGKPTPKITVKPTPKNDSKRYVKPTVKPTTKKYNILKGTNKVKTKTIKPKVSLKKKR